MSSDESFISSSESSSESSYISSPSSDEDVDQGDNLDLQGNIIKNYNVIYELGRGAFSIVWLVYNITDNLFYALKVQNSEEFKEGLQEIQFVSKLPTSPKIFNNLIEHFIEKRDNKKYLCSVWNLHATNLDTIIRKQNTRLSLDLIKKIMKQLIDAIKILHTKFKVFHGDIKSDNILIKGINNKDSYITQLYKQENFFQKYTSAKQKYWLSFNKDIKSIDNMSKNDKLKIRYQVHNDIVTRILKDSNISKDFSNIDISNISLADFGTYCEEDNYYDKPFGTRYYQAPEIILMGKCSYPVDIWALGCVFYELLANQFLFNPIKDANYTRDYYHLYLINDTCGDFPINFLKKTKYYETFFNKGTLIDYIKTENRLERKLNLLEIDSINKKVINEILTNMLQIDTSKRWTINDLAKHPFFKN